MLVVASGSRRAVALTLASVFPFSPAALQRIS
jgi:hypothetical protein